MVHTEQNSSHSSTIQTSKRTHSTGALINTWYTRSSAIAERPARRSVSVEMLFYCRTNNANRSPVSLRSTFSNCHVLFRYLHSMVHTLFNYRTASMGYQYTTNRVDWHSVQMKNMLIHPAQLAQFWSAHLLISPHGIAMPKGLYFTAVVSSYFSTSNLWGHWTDLNQTWTNIHLWLLFEKFGPNTPGHLPSTGVNAPNHLSFQNLNPLSRYWRRWERWQYQIWQWNWISQWNCHNVCT